MTLLRAFQAGKTASTRPKSKSVRVFKDRKRASVAGASVNIKLVIGNEIGDLNRGQVI